MSVSPPDIAADADRHLGLLGLLGLLRVTLFEAFGDRKYWNEHYADLFLSMLAKQLRGKVSTLEELTDSLSGISHSTKLRLIEEARRDGLIVVANRSDVVLAAPLDTPGARKVFFLSEGMVGQMLRAFEQMTGDIAGYAAGGSTEELARTL